MTTTSTRDCLHDGRAECWLCSDVRPWWREARIKAGLGEEPPNAPNPWDDVLLQAVEPLNELLHEWSYETWRVEALAAAGVGPA